MKKVLFSLALLLGSLADRDGDMVAYGNGVGGADAADAEVALNLALELLPGGGLDDVVRAGVAHDDAVQRGLVVLVLCHRLRRS